MSKIVFNPPTPDSPGYLRRLHAALSIREEWKRDLSPDAVANMVEFLLPYVTEPEDRAAAREALWDASEQQFDDLLALVTGGGESESPNP